jgi:hypothetical protein
MARALQNPRLQLRGEHRGDLADMPAVESGDPLLGKSLAPAGHKAAAAVDPLGGFIPRMAFGQQQESAALVGHLPPDPSGYWLAASVPYAPRSSR